MKQCAILKSRKVRLFRTVKSLAVELSPNVNIRSKSSQNHPFFLLFSTDPNRIPPLLGSSVSKSTRKMVKEIKKSAEFEKLVKNSSGLVVVDFFVSWCGPCKQIAPFVLSLSQKYPTAVFVKVDCDAQEAISEECKVSAFPTFQFFLNGKRVDQMKGADEGALEKKVIKHLPSVLSSEPATGSKKRSASKSIDEQQQPAAASSSSSSSSSSQPQKKKAKTAGAEPVTTTATDTIPTTTTNIDTPAKKKNKPWNVKPQNNEGVLVPRPKLVHKSTGVVVVDYVIGHGIEPKPGIDPSMNPIPINLPTNTVPNLSCHLILSTPYQEVKYK